MKKFSLIFCTFFLVSTCVVLVSCNEKHPDYESIEKDIYKKLIAFGDSGITMGHGQFVHLSVIFQEDTNERVISSILAVASLNSIVLNQTILADLSARNAGDIVKYIAPSETFVFGNLLDKDSAAHAKTTNVSEVRFEIHNILENSDSLRSYLQSCAQEGSMEETEAIRYWQVTCECQNWNELNDLSFAYYNQTQGDSIKSGKEILIRYNTYLLSGQKLDSLTEMKFTFGKPGQLIQGFQWGLAKLKEGEHVCIFMPSIWAFGEDGIPNGPVPPRTPVYIDVEVVEVN